MCVVCVFDVVGHCGLWSVCILVLWKSAFLFKMRFSDACSPQISGMLCPNVKHQITFMKRSLVCRCIESKDSPTLIWCVLRALKVVTLRRLAARPPSLMSHLTSLTTEPPLKSCLIFVEIFALSTVTLPVNHLVLFLSLSLVLFHQPELGLFALFGMLFSEGEELLGTEGARYMKMDDMKDHDDDFLSPKKSLEYERGLGTA